MSSEQASPLQPAKRGYYRKLTTEEWDDLVVAVETRPEGVTVHELCSAKGVSAQAMQAKRARIVASLIERGRLRAPEENV